MKNLKALWIFSILIVLAIAGTLFAQTYDRQPPQGESQERFGPPQGESQERFVHLRDRVKNVLVNHRHPFQLFLWLLAQIQNIFIFFIEKESINMSCPI